LLLRPPRETLKLIYSPSVTYKWWLGVKGGIKMTDYEIQVRIYRNGDGIPNLEWAPIVNGELSYIDGSLKGGIVDLGGESNFGDPSSYSERSVSEGVAEITSLIDKRLGQRDTVSYKVVETFPWAVNDNRSVSLMRQELTDLLRGTE
jgi:hypothetical protein